MKYGQRGLQSLRRLLIVGVVVTLGTVGVSAQGEQIQPPAGLTEVSPVTLMPVFQLPAMNGSTVNSSDLQGKVVVVRFWATW